MTVYPSQDSFVRGEISPRLHARSSLELYRSALAVCENFITLPHGGIRKRGGTYYAGSTKSNAEERPVPFIYSEEQAYMLFFGDGYFRVYAYGGPVLDGLDVVEVVTPYTADEIVDLQFEQSGDVLYVMHPNHDPRKITRSTNTDWAIAVHTVTEGPFGVENSDEGITMSPSAQNGTITITASSAVFDASMIGQLVRIKVESYEDWKAWEAGGFLTDGSPVGLKVRHNGNVYEADAPSGGSGNKIFMGSTPPVHLKGKEWDGGGQGTESFDGSADHHIYGVRWEYVHSGYGIARITAIGGGGTTATTVGTVNFPADLVGQTSYRWAIGSFGGDDGFPRTAAIFEERLFFGQKFSVYGSKTFDFESFRTGSAADDALSFQLAGAREITWMAEADGFLVIGTIGGVRTLSGGGQSETLTPSSFKSRASPTKRCSSIPPVKSGSSFIYVGFDRKSIVEMTFSLERNGYQTSPIALISEHIPKKGISSFAGQSDPDPMFWMTLENGELAGLTYEQDQQVRGLHRHRLGGSFGGTEWGFVEWVAVTPGQSGADDVWLVVKRTIGGATVRFIEVMQPAFEYGEIEDAFLVDAGLSYDGVAVNSVSGLDHLEGETVSALADGVIYRDIAVTGGVATLPEGVTAAKIHVGLPYTAAVETLELDVGGKDGGLTGRPKRVNGVIFSVLEAANLDVRSASRSTFELTRVGRMTVVPPSDAATLYTGNLGEIPIEDTWEGAGRIRVEAPDPVPATIRAIIPSFEGS
jgi:hypothetical protein